MSTALTAYTPTTPESAMMMATTLARSGLLSGDIQTPEQAFAIMAHGSELGLGPMTSLKGIIMVKGKVTLSAELMLHLIIRNGIKHEWLEDTDTVASVKLMRDGWAPYTSTFTMAEARKAGLTGGRNDMYAKYPRAMLRARAVSFGARAFCPDLLTGVYVHGELDDAPSAPEPMQDVTPEPEPEPHKWTPEEQRRFFAVLKEFNVEGAKEGHAEVVYDDLGAWLESTGRARPSGMPTDQKRAEMLNYLNTDAGRTKYWGWVDAREALDAEDLGAEVQDAAFEEVTLDDAAPKASAGLIELRRIVVELIELIGDDATVGDLAGSFGVEWKLEGVAGFDEITLGHFRVALDKAAVAP